MIGTTRNRLESPWTFAHVNGHLWVVPMIRTTSEPGNPGGGSGSTHPVGVEPGTA